MFAIAAGIVLAVMFLIFVLPLAIVAAAHTIKAIYDNLALICVWLCCVAFLVHRLT